MSLAHFCELHGPTSVLCTQALSVSCFACYQPSAAPVTATQQPIDHSSTSSPTYAAPYKDRRLSRASQAKLAYGDGGGCASCSISLPAGILNDARGKPAMVLPTRSDRTSLRTKEEVHACTGQSTDPLDGNAHIHPESPESFSSSESAFSCHTHSLEYVSSSNPAESSLFSTLRRATIRALSGEQLPRGQTSGPLCFGDPVSGYTIAYVFRLADPQARGRQRYYAFIALAGSDTRRAFDACAIVWSLFEQIAINIVEAAEEVAARTSLNENSFASMGQITPISSFLTGRTMDPDGYPRRGAANITANGIAELVDNERFFCELHMMFVRILQDLGRLLGGMKIIQPTANRKAVDITHSPIDESYSRKEGKDQRAKLSAETESQLSGDSSSDTARCPSPSCTPILVTRRHQVSI